MTPLVGHAAKPPNGPTDRGARGRSAAPEPAALGAHDAAPVLFVFLDVTASQTSAAEVWRR